MHLRGFSIRPGCRLSRMTVMLYLRQQRLGMLDLLLFSIKLTEKDFFLRPLLILRLAAIYFSVVGCCLRAPQQGQCGLAIYISGHSYHSELGLCVLSVSSYNTFGLPAQL